MRVVAAPALPEIMTSKAVLALLGISRTTLYRMEKRGMFPAYKIGMTKFYRRSEILAAITANRIDVTTTEPLTAA